MDDLKVVPAVEDKRPDLETTEKIRLLRRLLPTLENDARIAIRLRFWETMTIQEIATILELSWESTDRLIERSIQKLRAGFDELERQKGHLRAAS